MDDFEEVDLFSTISYDDSFDDEPLPIAPFSETDPDYLFHNHYVCRLSTPNTTEEFDEEDYQTDFPPPVHNDGVFLEEMYDERWSEDGLGFLRWFRRNGRRYAGRVAERMVGRKGMSEMEKRFVERYRRKEKKKEFAVPKRRKKKKKKKTPHNSPNGNKNVKVEKKRDKGVVNNSQKMVVQKQQFQVKNRQHVQQQPQFQNPKYRQQQQQQLSQIPNQQQFQPFVVRNVRRNIVYPRCIVSRQQFVQQQPRFFTQNGTFYQ